MRAESPKWTSKMDTAAMEAEIFGHVTWWNACPQPARLLLLSAALPVEAAAFVAHSNAMESVPTLSAADTAAVVLLSLTHLPHDDLASRAALNTYTAPSCARLPQPARSCRGARG